MSIVRFMQYCVAANAVLLIVQSVRVIAVYSAVYSLTPDISKRQLPLHVWLIATSYLIYVIATTYFLLFVPTSYALSRVLLYGAAGLLGQYSLWNVLQYDRRRYSRLTNFVDDDPV